MRRKMILIILMILVGQGVWFIGCDGDSSPTSVQADPTPTPRPGGAVCSCAGNVYNCDDFPLPGGISAQDCYNYCMQTTGRDVHGLDRDRDGLACEQD